ncbi:hypothetical protein QVD17_26213 [Tagetes erecta]|uniref:Uncharacterized protein n=1 Tax=Tagetes erecta TaxID=13708 RepID=A0AAD8NQL4_TARER|nr:hypothetical protein QVD17_26213 [Tagetes erecta]
MKNYWSDERNNDAGRQADAEWSKQTETNKNTQSSFPLFSFSPIAHLNLTNQCQFTVITQHISSVIPPRDSILFLACT